MERACCIRHATHDRFTQRVISNERGWIVWEGEEKTYTPCMIYRTWRISFLLARCLTLQVRNDIRILKTIISPSESAGFNKQDDKEG